MLNNLDIQPNTTINCWIAGILLFDFKLVYVPGEIHRPDGLSRCPIQPDDRLDPLDDYKDWINKAYGLMHIINPHSAHLHLPHSLYPYPTPDVSLHKATTHFLPPTSYTFNTHMLCLINKATDNPLDFTLSTIDPEQVFIPHTSEADATDCHLNLVISVLQTPLCSEDMIDSEWR